MTKTFAMVPDQSNLAGRFLSPALFVHILQTDFGLLFLSTSHPDDKCMKNASFTDV